jgi:ubiquinone/menaquinone biosynthesis C-methylase UbiE
MGGPILGIDIVPWSEMTNADKKDPHISQADWCLDIRDIPIKDNSMDFVFSHHVLEHIGKTDICDEDNYEALKEWIRILKSGGYLICVVPDINFCISPVARKRGLRIPHGLQPDEVLDILKTLPVEIVRFNEFESRDIFEFVVRKL